MVTDSIADFLTRIRNAQAAKHKVVEIPLTKTKKSLTEILYNQGYVASYKVENEGTTQASIKIALKYDKITQQPVIKKLERISRPGLRKYASATELPRVLNGLGIAIISTSKGLLIDKHAREQNVGGEVLCRVY